MTPPSPPPPARPLTVLVVDPTAVGRQLAEFLLRHRGHAPHAVSTAADARAVLAAGQFDLLLVDAALSPADVADLRQRAERSGRRVTVCAVAAEGAAVPPDCDAVATRPLEPKQLDELLARWFEPAVDAAALLDQLGGNAQLLQPMAQLLDKNARIWEAGLRAAIVADDAAAVRRLAHQAKGALGNFAARRAVAAARALEELGKAANLADAPRMLGELTVEIHNVQQALAELLHS
ncbi:MAG: Hpt domain-containing protein [Gemmataceae bacterium]